MRIWPFYLQNKAQQEEPSSREDSPAISSRQVFLAGLSVITTSAAAWMYLTSMQREESFVFSSEPNYDPSYPVANLEEGSVSLFHQTVSNVATFTQVAFSLLAPFGLALRLRNEQRERREPNVFSFPPKRFERPQRSLLSIEHGSSLVNSGERSRFENMPQMFYSEPHHRTEINSLAQIIATKEGVGLSNMLNLALGNRMKNWKLVDKDSFFITMSHPGLKGYFVLFPMRPSYYRHSFSLRHKKTPKNASRFAFTSLKMMEEWKKALVIEKDHYDQLVMPKIIYIKKSNSSSLIFKEIIEISSFPIGKHPEKAKEQFEKFHAEQVNHSTGFEAKWGIDVGFMTSLKGEKVEADQLAKIAIINASPKVLNKEIKSFSINKR